MANLALLGGDKSVKLDYNEAAGMPIVSEAGINSVVDLMRKGEISMSPIVGEFEEKFKKYIVVKYALCTNNGTSALFSALFAAGVEMGDEVIVPSYTFWATVGPIVAIHAIPIFCDVDKNTYCIDPVEIEKRITKKTKAIMIVHVWGNPCDMDSIMKIAAKHNLKVIEDASHAHGAMWKDKKIGSIGDVGCFSLQGTKTLPGGEGGIVVTNDRECYERAVALGHYIKTDKLPMDSKYKKYADTGFGYKLRINPLSAALASSALDTLEDRNKIRNYQGKYLDNLLADIEWLSPQKVYEGAEREYSYHFGLFDSEKFEKISLMTFLKALKAEGVICGFCGYGRLHNSPLVTLNNPYGKFYDNFSNLDIKLPITEYLAQSTFMLTQRFEKPCKDYIEQYSLAYHKIAKNVCELKKYEKEHIEAEQFTSSRSINLL